LNNKKISIGVLGGGSWATALVKILSDNSEPKLLNWWLRDKQKVEYIREFKHNKHYLSSVSFENKDLALYSDIQACIKVSDIVILAIPSAFVHKTFKVIDPQLFVGKSVISAVKGLIPETSDILGDYLNEQMNISPDRIGVITGPCHAEEVALEKLSYLTIGSENQELADNVASYLRGRFIKTTITDDIYGTEYSAVLKNVYAIAAGICHGLRYGDNFLAVLVSNGIREIKRFIAVLHPIERDTDDSAYLGDLMVTAYSQFSRNRTFGNMLGRGYSVKSAQLEMNMIAEGYYAVKTVFEMNQKLGVEMPIVDFVHAVVYGGKRAKDVVLDLVDRLN